MTDEQQPQGRPPRGAEDASSPSSAADEAGAHVPEGRPDEPQGQPPASSGPRPSPQGGATVGGSYGQGPARRSPGQGRPAGRPTGGRDQGWGRRDQRGPDRRGGPDRRDRPRGPRPDRGRWERDRGPRHPGPGPDRGPGYGRRPAGPPPAEILSGDEEVVAGRRPVEEAFVARREAKRLLVVPERRAALDQLVLHATTLRIPVVEVEGGTITAVAGFDGHQGVALVVAPRRWATLDEVLALARSRNEPPFVLALDHLEDPQNVGTLLRSAEACGVHGVVFPTKGAAPISPAAIKTSAGAVEHLLLVPMPDLAGALVDLHARGLRVIGADGDAQLTVREADMRGPIVIVTGSEGRGLNARVRKRVDLMARIPMRGKVASLNASVAGSVFLFEAAAQRDLPEAALAPAEEAPGAARAPEAAGQAADSSPPAIAPATGSVEVGGPVAPGSPPASADEADDLLPEAPATPRVDRD